MIKNSLCCLFSGLCLSAFSQNYYFGNYSVAQGLDQSKVYDILQADDHFIWLGTQSGVSVFDGKEFDNKNESDGLAPNGVRELYKDKKGRIWMGHNGGGISMFYKDQMVQIKHPDLEIVGDVTSFIEDSSGNFWITTHNSGAFQVTGMEKGLEAIQVKQFKGQSLSDWVFGSSLLKDSSLLFITDVGIKKYNPDSNCFETFYIEGLDLYFQFTVLFEDSEKNLWFGTYNGGLYKYDHARQSFNYFDEKNQLVDKWISSVTEDKHGNIWVGTWGGGISCFHKDGLVTNFSMKNGLQDNKIYQIHEDVEGNMLIGTFEHGLSIFKGFHFTHYNENNGLASNQVTHIAQDNSGHYWFGTNNGISVLNMQNNSITHFNKSSHNISNQINFIKKGPDGNMWIGTEEGVFKYYPQFNKFEFDIILNNKLMARYQDVKALEIDKWGQLWVGTLEGLVYYEIDNYRGDRLSQRNGLAGNNITALFIDSKDVLWIGSLDKGVTKFYNPTSTFTPVQTLGEITPVSFTEDPEGNIWIATESKGIIVFDGDTIVRRLTMDDGLLSDMVTALNADNNNIYIGSNRGLNVYSIAENKVYTYTEKGGFVGIETKENASFTDTQGNIWFGTVAGAIKYNPSKKIINKLEPLTHIKSIEVRDQKEPLAMVTS
jgi:ligand-binding sensor domain-containing protein